MADRHVTLYSKKGLLTKVSGIKGLAAHLGVKSKQVQSTFSDYNKGAAAGRDSFNRTVFPAGHWPIESDEDFYVGRIVPVIHYTMGGIAIDPHGRVLADATEKPIDGLYAVGEASGGVHGDNRLAGNSLLECTVFGRHVGLTLPVRTQAASPTTSGTPASPGFVPPADPSKPAETKAGAVRGKVSKEELAEHTTKEKGHWVSLYGQVYDLTDYAEEHPGGEEAILDVAGTDGTETFAAVHNRELLESMGFEPVGQFQED